MASRSASPSAARPIQVKLVLLGQAAAGKSSLVLRFVNNEFQENKEPTIGAAFLTQKVKLTEDTIKFEIWDTAGQERFHSLAPMYYRNSQASVVVFDITKASSLQKAKTWVKELQRQANTNIIIALAGNKTDLAESRQVTTEEASQYAEEENLLYFETSAKTGDNVQAMFTEIAQRIPKEYIMHERRSKSAASGLMSSTPPIDLDQPSIGRPNGVGGFYHRQQEGAQTNKCGC